MIFEKEANKMNNLPEEIVLMIFNHIHIIDLLKCKRVNKRFNHLICQIKFKELVLKRPEGIDFNEKFNCWYHSFKPINLKNTIIVPWKNNIYNYFFNFRSFIKTFSQLKKLKINLMCQDFCLYQVNNFPNLENLQVDNQIEIGENLELILPNLKILHLGFIDYQLKINSNCLNILSCFELDDVCILNPETVTNLEIETDRLKILSLKKFSNLKVFKVNDFSWLNDDFLDNLPATIKQVHLNYPYQNLNGVLIEKAKLIFEDNQRRSKFEGLKFYLEGVELESRSAFSDYGFQEERIQLFSKNYDRLEQTLPWFVSFNYSMLLETFKNQLPSSFFDKFINLQSILTDRTVDENHFLLFLKNCSNLNKLELHYPSLSQTFYNKLPIICNLIQDFKLKENRKLELDYEFISKFKLLKIFQTTHYLSIDLVTDLLNYLNFMLNLRYKIDRDKPLIIERKIDKTFKVICNKRKWKRIDTVELLVTLLVVLKNENFKSNKRIKSDSF